MDFDGRESLPARVSRRAFVKHGTLFLASPVLDCLPSAVDDRIVGTRLGLITDLHYADKAPAGSRHYRESISKLAEACDQFRKDQVELVVELGDFIDAVDSVDLELQYLKVVNRDFAAAAKDRHYVLGNHCVDTLTKKEFLGAVEQTSSYYSFDRGHTHFVILDACFRSDGQPYGRKNSEWTDANLPAEELEWLKSDLESTTKPVIVFVHQRLDVSSNHGVKNGPQIRQLLECSGKVLAVFQGHSHQNDLKEINGIHYCTLVAMVEGSGADNNGYSVMNIAPDGSITITGFRQQKPYEWNRQL